MGVLLGTTRKAGEDHAEDKEALRGHDVSPER
jgi:hypothetical protein